MKLILKSLLRGALRLGKISAGSSALALGLILCCALVHAQVVPDGAMTGVVTDPSGAAIVGARVTAWKVSGSVQRTV
ncbi:MAG TPA: hypothetical protein VGV15_22655, partial [Terriglobales bacterium]|nr:hypothetical protein [Terriglobales bacterium]